jgi:hypothetical protein
MTNPSLLAIRHHHHKFAFQNPTPFFSDVSAHCGEGSIVE